MSWDWNYFTTSNCIAAYGANVLPVGLAQQYPWAASRAGAGVFGGGEEIVYRCTEVIIFYLSRKMS